MTSAMFDGFGHMRGSPAVKAVLVRSAVFSISASALPALLPLLAHPFGSQGYGLLLGFFGVGALVGAAFMSSLRSRSQRGCCWSPCATAVFRLHHLRRRTMAGISAAVDHHVRRRRGMDPDSRQPERIGANHVSGAHARPRHLDVPAGAARRTGRRRGVVGRNRRARRDVALALLCGHWTGCWVCQPPSWFRLHPGELQPTVIGMD